MSGQEKPLGEKLRLGKARGNQGERETRLRCGARANMSHQHLHGQTPKMLRGGASSVQFPDGERMEAPSL